MATAIMEPIDTLDRLTDLCVEAKRVLKEADRADLGRIDQFVDLLLFEIAILLARTGDYDRLNGNGGA